MQELYRLRQITRTSEKQVSENMPTGNTFIAKTLVAVSTLVTFGLHCSDGPTT